MAAHIRSLLVLILGWELKQAIYYLPHWQNLPIGLLRLGSSEKFAHILVLCSCWIRESNWIHKIDQSKIKHKKLVNALTLLNFLALKFAEIWTHKEPEPGNWPEIETIIVFIIGTFWGKFFKANGPRIILTWFRSRCTTAARSDNSSSRLFSSGRLASLLADVSASSRFSWRRIHLDLTGGEFVLEFR